MSSKPLTQEYTIRTAVPSDIEAVTGLERICFPQAEAADKETFTLRIQNFSHCFWLMEENGRLVAMVNGMTTDSADLCDEMYEGTMHYSPDGKWLMIFGVASHPEKQHQGLASALLRHVIGTAEERGLAGIVLTCKEKLVPFYERAGFANEGISGSQHGGAAWYQMRLITERKEHGQD